MLLPIHPVNPNPRNFRILIDCLQNGGVIIYPTDTVYGMGCDIYNSKAVERICRIKGIKPEKANFSFICSDLSHIADFTKPEKALRVADWLWLFYGGRVIYMRVGRAELQQ